MQCNCTELTTALIHKQARDTSRLVGSALLGEVRERKPRNTAQAHSASELHGSSSLTAQNTQKRGTTAMGTNLMRIVVLLLNIKYLLLHSSSGQGIWLLFFYFFVSSPRSVLFQARLSLLAASHPCCSHSYSYSLHTLHMGSSPCRQLGMLKC